MNDIGAARSGSELGFAYRELFRGQLIFISVSISCVVVMFHAVAGPGGEVLPDLLPRLGYFGLIAALSWPMGHGMAALLLYWARRGRPYHVVLASLAGAAYIAVNVAMVGYAIHRLMIFAGQELYPWSAYYLRALVPSLLHIGVINYLACQRARFRPIVEGVHADDSETETAQRATDATVDARPSSAMPGAEQGAVTVGASTAGVSPEERDGGALQSVPEARKAAGLAARFLDRLPPEAGRDVIYLKVSGHYITVVTTAGSGILLMRFADAVAELEGAGMQVHRSFWVAYRHITAIEQREGRIVVCLTGGEVVSVSRTFIAAVRAAASRETISFVS